MIFSQTWGFKLKSLGVDTKNFSSGRMSGQELRDRNRLFFFPHTMMWEHDKPLVMLWTDSQDKEPMMCAQTNRARKSMVWTDDNGWGRSNHEPGYTEQRATRGYVQARCMPSATWTHTHTHTHTHTQERRVFNRRTKMCEPCDDKQREWRKKSCTGEAWLCGLTHAVET